MADGTIGGPAGADEPSGARPFDRQLLAVEVETVGAEVSVTVRGELDESTAPNLIDQVQGAIDRAGSAQVVIDLHGLTFCGSAGLSALIVLHRAAADAGGSLVVARPTVFVVELLGMAGLDDLIAGSASD